jgi:hypothetical protein
MKDFGQAVRLSARGFEAMSMRRTWLRHLGGFVLLVALVVTVGGCGGDDQSPLTGTDTTPPSTPVGLQGTSVQRTIHLSWTPNSEPDLAGYSVYSSTDPGDPSSYELTGIVPAGSSSFADTREPGHEYGYKVTAVDASDNASPPSGEVAVVHPMLQGGVPLEDGDRRAVKDPPRDWDGE